MVFQEKPINRNISLVYGFTSQDKETYDFVLVLQRKFNVTYIHGMLSRVPFLTIYKDLWMFLGRICKTRYIGFEVLVKHYPAYKLGIPIAKEIDTKSFDGFPTKTLLVKRNALIQPLNKNG